ncbi:hypothetical protein L226DRAFT_205260 [Lentinus tigrinus ALCF2SS1-7]|uniref:uncharacterized protein n=1 Tax=Lentinus tigrinus ALCF2SS1-7 TaxID=1328758 RepID=UPI001165CDE5|nr:hypothetical protein L226DRAFT_205260 [Lentinus tigrinus ALCF2SS1-7]
MRTVPQSDAPALSALGFSFAVGLPRQRAHLVRSEGLHIPACLRCARRAACTGQGQVDNRGLGGWSKRGAMKATAGAGHFGWAFIPLRARFSLCPARLARRP